MTPKRRIIPVFIPHAGCEHACVFCDQRRITGVKDATFDEDIIISAESLIPDGCPAEIAFYGGSFTAIAEERQNALLTAVQPFLSKGSARSVRISTRPDCVDEQTLLRLIGYGVKTVEIGAQSMCEDVLSQARRGHTAGDVARAAGLIKQAGLSLILQMMTGLPGDDREKSLYTARRFIGLKPDGVRIYPTVVVRGTELYDMWRSGCYREHTVNEATDLCAELYVLFEEAGIPVIRLGLNPTEALSAGGAAAGAYHPAFGELVYSKMYYDKAAKLLSNVRDGSSVTIVVPKGNSSRMIGQHRCNIRKLMEEFALGSINVVETGIRPDEIWIEITS